MSDSPVIPYGRHHIDDDDVAAVVRVLRSDFLTQGPAVGEILRDLVLVRQPPVDVGPLGVERFDAAALRPEYNVV